MTEQKRQAREVIPPRLRAAGLRSWQRMANRIGYDLQPLSNGLTEEQARRTTLLAAREVDLVLDVGANAGQFAEELRRGGYAGRIVSFEPLAAAYKHLEGSTEDDELWDCRRLALGATDGYQQIHVAGNTTSSSMLEMEDRHLESAPEARYVGTEEVAVARLDSIWPDVVQDCKRPYLKLDVQGYEMEVLRGAESCLDHVVGVQAELSLVPLYAGAPTFHTVIAHLEQRGFRLAGLEAGHDDRRTGEMLQTDGIFVRA